VGNVGRFSSRSDSPICYERILQKSTISGHSNRFVGVSLRDHRGSGLGKTM
jgi:hypothetical protein